MPGRKFNGTAYRYGFNGKEKDDEMDNLEGGDLDFGARMYDARLGRWLACDPYANIYPDMSPYSFALNNPVRFIDPDGNIIVDKHGFKVKVRIKKDSEGNYVASYKFDKKMDADDIKEFKDNGGRVIKAMITTPTGREIIKQAKRTSTRIEYELTEDPLIQTSSASGETGITYAYNDPEYEDVVGSPGEKVSKQTKITISLGTYKYGQTVDPNTGLGNPDLLPGGEGGAFKDLQVKDPSRMYGPNTTEEEFINGVGVHETTHALNDLYVLMNLIGKAVDAALETIKGHDSQVYKAVEEKPNQNEDKSRHEHNNRSTKPQKKNPIRYL